MQKFTRSTGANTATSFVESGDAKEKNLQAACESLAGIISTEGVATWAALTTLTVTDTRVTSTSRITGLTASVNAPLGFWYIVSQAAGSFVIGSSETEIAGTIASYNVINPA